MTFLNLQHLQEPINCNDQGDVISWQAYGCQHNDHGDQSSLRDSRCSDASGCGCDTEEQRRRRRLVYGDSDEHCGFGHFGLWKDLNTYLMVRICPKLRS